MYYGTQVSSLDETLSNVSPPSLHLMVLFEALGLRSTNIRSLLEAIPCLSGVPPFIAMYQSKKENLGFRGGDRFDREKYDSEADRRSDMFSQAQECASSIQDDGEDIKALMSIQDDFSQASLHDTSEYRW